VSTLVFVCAMQVTEVATSRRLQSNTQRSAKVSAGQPLQDTNSSSGSKAQRKRDYINKLRSATQELQMRMRKRQEKRQAEAKVSQGRAIIYSAGKPLPLLQHALCPAPVGVS
jgi:hypothetical protein